MHISLIVAAALNRVIGKGNQLPWHMPADLRFFKQKTTGHHILMGSRTFQSIGRILPNRVTIVVSSQMDENMSDYQVVRSIKAGIQWAECAGETELFVVGGAQIYAQTLPLADRVYVTQIQASVPGDAYFPILGTEWVERSRQFFQADAHHVYDHVYLVFERKYTKLQ
ncbi:MAG TPA: dihydrofolate reductase [Amoebophilaceae bacterium]|jgi:dihydrofolate reductase|nr:dihydrofolate reductase [Amoebophilaceae bacterium]